MDQAMVMCNELAIKPYLFIGLWLEFDPKGNRRREKGRRGIIGDILWSRALRKSPRVKRREIRKQ